jgi:hypothetical protein
MLKIEANKWLDFSPSRRHFLWMLWWAALVPVIWVKNAVAQVLDIEKNEMARRDIIIILNPYYWGKSWYNTIETLRVIFSWEIKKENIIKNVNILRGELKYFTQWSNQEISDQIWQAITLYQQTSPQIQKRQGEADWWGQYERSEWVNKFEQDIRAFLDPLLRTFANKVQGPLTSTDSKGKTHYYHWKPKSIPDAYNDKHFFWTNVWKNLSGTYINAQLEKYIWNQIPDFYEAGKITILTSKIWGKNFLAVYDTDGAIKILTYVSIGTEEDPTHLPPLITKNVWEVWLIQMNKISVQAKGSSMWWWVHIRGGIYYHSSALWIDWEPKSHGCIRTPLLYLDGLHKIIKSASSGTQIDMRFQNLY